MSRPLLIGSFEEEYTGEPEETYIVETAPNQFVTYDLGREIVRIDWADINRKVEVEPDERIYIAGGITRDTFVDMLVGVPHPLMLLLSWSVFASLLKFGRDEIDATPIDLTNPRPFRLHGILCLLIREDAVPRLCKDVVRIVTRTRVVECGFV